MEKVRLDKFLSSSLIISRSDATEKIKKGLVTVNGSVEKSPNTKINPSSDDVFLSGSKVDFADEIYIMLNKPQGLISATSGEDTVLSLFEKSYVDKGLFPCGRLDKNTTGLLIITTDGPLSHHLLSPKHHAEKIYDVVCDKEFTQKDVELMQNGIMMDGKMTKPALCVIDEQNKCRATITLTEGKFHQIKRFCYACGQKEVLSLKRTFFAGLHLDASLSEGQWRHLTQSEIDILKNA